MSTIQLTGGDYRARSLPAAAQRCLNLYTEHQKKEEGEVYETVTYPTPGLTLLASGGGGGCRCLYRASNGKLYGIYGNTVYAISSAWVFSTLGTINFGTSICSMADNGINILIVDGTTSGWSITMATNAFATISSAGFLGGVSVWYIDTYFVLCQPGTGIFYNSDSMAITFNPLNFASKSGYADPIGNMCVVNHQLWFIGSLAAEIWNDVGGSSFPFQIVQGVFIEHGITAPYSLARQDLACFWLSQDLAGQAIFLQGAGYEVERISTFPMENEMRSYSTIADAEAYCYQANGAEFYVCTFPTANKTWVYNRATKEWHQLATMDTSGNELRHQSRLCANAYGKVVVGDYSTGRLYALDFDAYTDNGIPIKRVRTFPHFIKDQNRVSYRQLIAIMECGSTLLSDDALVSLRWSDDGGRTWGNPLVQSFGMTGEYLTSVQFQRLGMARSRVFELSWSTAAKTALMGASIQIFAWPLRSKGTGFWFTVVPVESVNVA